MAEAKKTVKKAVKTAPNAVKKASAKSAPKKPVVRKATVNKNEFAVIETGGKQYKVSAGETITIEKLSDVREVGAKVIFDKVLLVDDGKDTTIGMPYIKQAKVEGVLTEEGKGKKILVVHYKAKSRHLVRKGHRQPFAKVTITAIR